MREALHLLADGVNVAEERVAEEVRGGDEQWPAAKHASKHTTHTRRWRDGRTPCFGGRPCHPSNRGHRPSAAPGRPHAASASWASGLPPPLPSPPPFRPAPRPSLRTVLATGAGLASRPRAACSRARARSARAAASTGLARQKNFQEGSQAHAGASAPEVQRRTAARGGEERGPAWLGSARFTRMGGAGRPGGTGGAGSKGRGARPARWWRGTRA